MKATGKAQEQRRYITRASTTPAPATLARRQQRILLRQRPSRSRAPLAFAALVLLTAVSIVLYYGVTLSSGLPAVGAEELIIRAALPLSAKPRDDRCSFGARRARPRRRSRRVVIENRDGEFQ